MRRIVIFIFSWLYCFVAVFFSAATGQTTLTAYDQSLSVKEADTKVITLSASSSNLMFAVVKFPQKGTLYQYNSSVPGQVGNVMLASRVDDPSHRVVYKAKNFQMTTTDSFGFIVQDNNGNQSQPGNITITLLSVNDPPFCMDMYQGRLKEEQIPDDVEYGSYGWDHDTEFDAVELTITYMSRGQLQEIDYSIRPEKVLKTYTPEMLPQKAATASSYFRYLPPKDFVGFIYINYILNDGFSDSIRYESGVIEPCTVSVEFENVEDPPFATDVSFITDEDTLILVTLNCTDFDPKDSITQYRIFASEGHGIYQYSGDQIDYTNSVMQVLEDLQGRFWFSPSKDYYGMVQIEYLCRDKDLVVSNPAVAKIMVNPVNDSPSIHCQEQIDLLPEFVNGGTEFMTIKLSAYDAEYEHITFKIVGTPQRGYLFGDNQAIYSAGDSVIGNTVIFNANSSGASAPYANFSFIAIDEHNASSEICIVRLNATCDKGRFLNVFSDNTGKICAPCPNGAICSRNGSFLPIPTYGHWKVPERDNLFLACSPPSACPGYSEKCSPGYSGPLCAKCASGYFRLNADCVPCRLGVNETLGIAAAVIVLGSAVIYLSTNISKRGPALGLFGLFVNFVQTVTVIRGLELPWPVEFKTITDALSVLSLNLDLVSPECFLSDLSQFRFKMRTSLIFPGVLLAVVSLCALIGSISWGKFRVKLSNVLSSGSYSKTNTSSANLLCKATIQTAHTVKAVKSVENYIVIGVIKIANILLSISYLSISKYSLGLFDCVRELDGKIYLDPDKSLQCYQDWWTEDVPIASFGIVFYVIGIPLYYFAQLLIIGQSNWTNSRMQKIRNLCRKTFGGDSTFREGYQFCILLQLIQKLALLLINMFFTRLLLAQIMSMLVILHVSFVFYWSFRPYAYQSLNYLELAGIACSKIVLLGGIMFHVPPLITEKERKLLSNSIVALVIGYLVAIIGAVVYEYFVIRRKSKSAGK